MHIVTLKVFTEFEQYGEHILQIKEGDFGDWVKGVRDLVLSKPLGLKLGWEMKSPPQIAKERVTWKGRKTESQNC